MSSLGFLLRLRRRERKSRPRKDPGPFPPQPLPTLRLMKLMTSAGPSFRAGTASRLSELRGIASLTQAGPCSGSMVLQLAVAPRGFHCIRSGQPGRVSVTRSLNSTHGQPKAQVRELRNSSNF